MFSNANTSFAGYDPAVHKPRVKLVRESCGHVHYACTDGGLTQYGLTPEKAYNQLKAVRGL